MIECRLGSYGDVRKWRAAAAREHVALTDKPNAIWYLDDNGCACVYEIRPGRFRVRAVFVDPAARGSGVGTKLTEAAIREAEKRGAESIDVFAWNPAFYVERGFMVVGKNPFGATHLRRMIKCDHTTDSVESKE